MIQRNSILLLFLTIALFVKPFKCWEYCHPDIQWKLCRADNAHAVYKNHTVCVPSMAFDSTVNYISEKFLAHVPITRKIKRILMEIHNDYRNRVASGNEIKNGSDGDIKKYPIAARMRELIWDDELMYVSHIHTKEVKMGHDKCRNTRRYMYSGQNLGWKGTTNYISVVNFMYTTLEEMYVEKDNVPDPVATAAKYTSDLKKYHVGHFTAMVNDRISRMGCAVAIGAYCRNNLKPNSRIHNWCYYLGCNYDATNINNDVVYVASDKAGSRCSDWKTGMSTKYKYLCHNTGEYYDILRAPRP